MPPLAARKPFAGANLITIATPDSARQAVQNFKRILHAQGLQLDSVGSDHLKTKGLVLAAAGVGASPTVQVFRVRAVRTVTGTLLVLTGEYAQDLGPKYHFTFPMRWLSPKNSSDNQACFVQAEIIAKSYPGGVIGYLQRPVK